MTTPYHAFQQGRLRTFLTIEATAMGIVTVLCAVHAKWSDAFLCAIACITSAAWARNIARKPGVETAEYWTEQLEQSIHEFPTHAEERILWRSWAMGIYQKKLSASTDALLTCMEIKETLGVLRNDSVFHPSLEDRAINIRELEHAHAKAQGEVRKKEEERLRCETFFFEEWPQGSGILKDGGSDLPEPVPESPVPENVLV